MPSLSCNDLIGLEYGWGHAPSDGNGKTDCFQLVCELRTRLDLSDYRQKFSWVYEQFDETTFPRRNIVRWLLEHGRRITAQPGAVMLLPASAGAALGTVLTDGVVYIGPSKTVIYAPIPAGIGHSFWMER